MNHQYADYLLKTYGPSVARRYAAIANNSPAPSQPLPIRTNRWVSNQIHREKAFTPIQAATIRSHYQAGYSCRDLAQQWGVSQGTISSVLRRQGCYR